MDIFYRAVHGMPLSPAERALLKLIDGFVLSGVLAALGALAIVFSQDNAQVTMSTLPFVAGAFAVGVLSALKKYLTARNDPVSLVAAAEVGQVQAALVQRVPGLSDVKTPDVEVPVAVTPSTADRPAQ